MELYNLVSLTGIVVLLALAWLLSEHRRQLNWRVTLGGLAFLLAFGLFMFVSPAGPTVFRWVNDAVNKVLDSAGAGTRFVLGRLALPPGATDAQGQTSLGFILACQALPSIIFFSALVSVLYYYDVLPRLIRFFAWLFSRALRLSGAESLCAASDIFVGIEASLTIRPHLAGMTRSELCTILTTGMASIASNVLAMYVAILNPQFPTIAGHLVSASFLAIPAALVMSKILLPETGRPLTYGRDIEAAYRREGSLFEAVINGAMAGVKLIVGIVALLIAVLGLAALVDLLLNTAGGQVNAWFGTSLDLSLRSLLGLLFVPFALVMGVPPGDAVTIGRIVGERLVLTEVASYHDLAMALQQGALVHPRSAVIAAYALCGFAHIASMAIFVGGIAALAPERKETLARLGLRALVGATLATLLVGCVAGACYTGPTLLFGPAGTVR
jgi:CNT family concentrative nucleoside transporter